ncbi:hypothetical protein EV663_10411 [Rhodovulum bhavnagarense]|uniref:Cation/multidrug efflux pump n=1 Tax=Rhodovulum bhavnagarense TaxID=992286 RepID=A0A4R2RDL3_9RHOB|nr:hypothetical protein [Rhodovulum bhavnagarense]TCP61560.1 hypothetical protein EV663_10411 [Rhodovulum bhavnagarense]
MIALLRFVILGFVALSVVYISLSLYSRAVRRERLKREWDQEADAGERDAFVRAGLEEYDRSLRRKLILGVYIVPITVIGTIIYVINYT